MYFATFGIPYALHPVLQLESKCRFFFTFKHLQAPNRSWKISHRGPRKVLNFFIGKRVGTLAIDVLFEFNTAVTLPFS